jgi:hypothetical protein
VTDQDYNTQFKNPYVISNVFFEIALTFIPEVKPPLNLINTMVYRWRESRHPIFLDAIGHDISFSTVKGCRMGLGFDSW